MHACSCTQDRASFPGDERVTTHWNLCRRRAGYKVEADDIARTLKIDPSMHPVVQAALGADYFPGVMTPVHALAAINETPELRAPLTETLSLTQVGPSMHGPRVACQHLWAPSLHVQSLPFCRNKNRADRGFA